VNLILCMAGLYRRFREAGYAIPKFLLPWEDETILSEILGRMLADGVFSSLTLVGNRRDSAHRPAIEAILRDHGQSPDALVLNEDTIGQAETALIGIEALERRLEPNDRRIVFHNIDTILLGRNYRSIAVQLQASDGFIDVFPSDSPAFSYVRIDDDGMVSDIAEKRVISAHATSGFYGFASIELYRKAYASCTWTGQERYISDLYRSLLASGARLRADEGGPEAQTIVLGTPAEYEAACLLSQGQGAHHSSLRFP